jgi:hypothetical protein
MNNFSRLAPVALLLCAAGCGSTSGGGQRTPSAPQARPGTVQTPGPTSRVSEDTVYIVRHYVRPERRAHFEDFVQTVLWPAFRQSATAQPSKRDLLRSVRLLQPVRPEDDGVLTYTFLLDPYVRGESYNVLELLRGVYPEDEARRQYSRFTETWARDFTTHAYVQSRGLAAQ